jgi:DNA-binding GntR family transcriptional regulator
MYSDAESVEFVAIKVESDAPDYVIEALRLPAGSAALRRTRLIKRDDEGPIELSTSWFAPELADLAPKLLIAERLRGGTAKYLASVTGRPATYARDQVAARLATAEELRLLQLTEPAGVLVYRLTAYDATDTPVQFDEATYPPDRWAFRQEYPIDM